MDYFQEEHKKMIAQSKIGLLLYFAYFSFESNGYVLKKRNVSRLKV
jgi:hypothetical protein